MGGKKNGQEPSAIRDPETEELLVSSKELKRATLSYCLKNLKNNTMTSEGEKVAAMKAMLHEMRMREDTKEEFEIEKEECEEVDKKVKGQGNKEL